VSAKWFVGKVEFDIIFSTLSWKKYFQTVQCQIYSVISNGTPTRDSPKSGLSNYL